MLSSGGANIPHPTRPPLGPTQLPTQGVPALIQVGKATSASY